MRYMKSLFLLAVVFVSTSLIWAGEVDELPSVPHVSHESDWLINAEPYRAGVYKGDNPNEIIISNGLLRRVFRIAPNGATVAFDNLMTSESILRSVRPEAEITLDGHAYTVGGLIGQPNHAYLLSEWLDNMKAMPGSFNFTGFEVGKPQATMPFKRDKLSPDTPWPPKGVLLRMDYKLQSGEKQPEHKELLVSVYYELYDGIPVLCKWFEIKNASQKTVRLNKFASEILAFVESNASVDENGENWVKPQMHIESDYQFHGMDSASANEVVHWYTDPTYTTQVNFHLKTPCLLKTHLKAGPEVDIAPDETFTSFRVYELLYDRSGRERRGLAQRKMYRTLAPWAMENPLMMHVRSAQPEAVRKAIDQCAAVGFEMVILTFGSGFNIENESPEYIAHMKELVDYAHSKGIRLGGYSLLASRRINDENDVINPATGKPGGIAKFGNSPCIGSKWGQDYFRKLYSFIEKTGFDLLEHDGSYPGDLCASTKHPGHKGYEDSQWQQFQTITKFYKWCRGRGVFLNVPDYYYLQGSNKSGMGYRETNWSLPRAQQVIHARQNIYDGTWEKTPSMGWMFVPLTQYHGGGAAATVEPLHEHLDHYRKIMLSNLSMGVQACYRGPRIYDTEQTKEMVKESVAWFKKYRGILESDIIHGRRADGRDIDWMLHVNPQLENKGMLIVFNPLAKPVKCTITVPLYYTGLTDKAQIGKQDKDFSEYKLKRDYTIELEINIPADSMQWYVVK